MFGLKREACIVDAPVFSEFVKTFLDYSADLVVMSCLLFQEVDC